MNRLETTTTTTTTTGNTASNTELFDSAPTINSNSMHSTDYLSGLVGGPAGSGGGELNAERPFKDQHHPLIKAIWNVDRFNPKLDEKLKELRLILKKHNPSILCDILHDVTGQPIAQATPLIIACFEGDPDVIKLLIENCADVNQTESEHHLTPLHVICDAEYYGQSLRVITQQNNKSCFNQICFSKKIEQIL